jgi:predicted alpha/beta-hydrolase family hydrolase
MTATTDPVEFSVEAGGETTTAREFRAEADGPLLVLAHGAGADQRHRFMVSLARRLAAHGVTVVTFNFLYTERKRKTPDRAPVLEQTWRTVLEAVGARVQPRGVVAVGGKSMGGRIASQVVASRPAGPAWQRVGGLVLLGYPLHPPGQPEKPRTAHLPDIAVPILLVQGTRDAFGTRAEIEPIFGALKTRVDYEFIDGGDHSFAVPKSSGRTEHDVLDGVGDRVASWIAAL